jgi:hypothetical protein
MSLCGAIPACARSVTTVPVTSGTQPKTPVAAMLTSTDAALYR